MLHAKIMTVDGIVANIGSANLNARSMALDEEINLVAIDRRVVTRSSTTTSTRTSSAACESSAGGGSSAPFSSASPSPPSDPSNVGSDADAPRPQPPILGVAF